MPTQKDIEAMIARMAIGDRAAFSSLYDATSGKLFAVCLRILDDRGEAEDALQDSFVRIWNKADSYAVTGHSPMTWLITITRNIAIDRRRARRTPAEEIESMQDRLSDGGPTPEAAAIAASERARIGLCLDELDPPRADAVRGVYLNGESYQDLASRFDVPLNTMRTWLRRSLLKLKDCLSR